jgi:hypothetical protein
MAFSAVSRASSFDPTVTLLFPFWSPPALTLPPELPETTRSCFLRMPMSRSTDEPEEASGGVDGRQEDGVILVDEEALDGGGAVGSPISPRDRRPSP